MTTSQSSSRLYLFSSNGNSLYLQDAVNALSLPAGSVMHFRYEEKYVSNQLKTAKNLPSGIPVLICLVDRKGDYTGVNDADKIIYPLRHGELIHFEKHQGIVHFWFTLSGHVQTQNDTEYRAVVSTVVGQVGEQLTLNDPLAVISSYVPLPERPGDHGFVTLVRALASESINPERFAFVKFDSVHEIDEKKHSSVPVRERSYVTSTTLPRLSRYEWKNERLYALQLTWWNPVIPHGRDQQELVLEVICDNAYFNILGPTKVPLNGRYDTSIFYLASQKQANDVSTYLTIKVTEQEDSDEGPDNRNGSVLGIQATFPVLILSNRNLLRALKKLQFFADFAIAIGALLLTIAGVVSRFSNSSGNALPENVTLLLTYAGVSTLLGAIAKGIVNYIRD